MFNYISLSAQTYGVMALCDGVTRRKEVRAFRFWCGGLCHVVVMFNNKKPQLHAEQSEPLDFVV